MLEDRIHEARRELRVGKEGTEVEFKEALGRDGHGKVPAALYETICSFSNRDGGNIYLGVQDDGKILGLAKSNIAQMKKDIISTVQSRNKFVPQLYLEIEELNIEHKNVLYIYVAENSSVVKMSQGRIFDRDGDADKNITDNTALVRQMYNRKLATYSENRIFPFADLTDFRSDLISRMRESEISFSGLTDFDILKSLSLYKRKDLITGTGGFTLAAILLFGTDEAIHNVLPYFKINVLVRLQDLERYDDRLLVQTNLFDCYTQIMEFLGKYLNDPFFLEKDKRINIREALFRELVVNMLVHREYSNDYPSLIEIYSDHIQLTNANKPTKMGTITTPDIIPTPKNPAITAAFRHMKLADDIGSGIGKIFKYGQQYFGKEPILENKDIFKARLPINNNGLSNLSQKMSQTPHEQVMTESDFKPKEPDKDDSLTFEQLQVLAVLTRPMSMNEIFQAVKTKGTNANYFRTKNVTPLVKIKKILLTDPAHPRSRLQKYYRAPRSKNN